MKNVIYVLGKDTKLIFAFDADVPFRMSDIIPIPQVASPRDLAACETHNFLYVVDEGGKYVWKISCTNFKVERWLSGIGDPFKISITKGGGVLIPRTGKLCAIEVMRSDAKLEKRIKLPDEIKDIEHALQSPSETLIISYGRNKSKNSGIMEISMDGVILKTHSLMREALSEMMDPRHMTLCRGNTVLVADCRNDRVIAFDGQLQAKQVLQNNILRPDRVCYIEDRKYLIVVHCVRRFQYYNADNTCTILGNEVVVFKCS